MAHAYLSASGAPGWVRCSAKPYRESLCTTESNDAADEGTCAHLLRDECLRTGEDASFFIGEIVFIREDFAHFAKDDGADMHLVRYQKTVDVDMAYNVQKSIDELRALAVGGTLHSEQKLDISFLTGEENAEATCDTIIVKGNTLIIDDLKYGHNLVHASSEQLLIYGAAALREYDVLGEIDTVVLRISQPRAEDSEITLTVAELEERLAPLRSKAKHILSNDQTLLIATAGDIQCKYCKAKATCDANRGFLLEAVVGGFDDITEAPLVLKKGEIAIGPMEVERVIANAYGVKPTAITQEGNNWIIKKPNLQPQLEATLERIATSEDEDLATLMDAADMIEGTVKAIRAEVERRLLAGVFTDPRYKLVEGKRGSRKWIDDAEAEKIMKSMRLKVAEMYDLKLKSAPAMESVLRDNPKKWARLANYFEQANGKPHVAVASDKRSAINMDIASQFAEVIFTPGDSVVEKLIDIEDLV